jgi:hypothetical protein
VTDVVRLSVVDWKEAAAILRGLSADVVIVEALGVTYGEGAWDFLRRLESLPLPTAGVVGGRCDASALAVLATVSLGFSTDDALVSVDADTVLALGLTSALPAAIGLAPARGLLFGGDVNATALRRSGLARSGDPAAAAARLAADPAAALLVRSLRVAARSSVAQARQYDAELRHAG